MSSSHPTVSSPIDEPSALHPVGQEPPERGAIVGRYVVLAQRGAGAMGVVLAAYDPKLDRKVALKLLKRDRESSTSGRLQREAQALAKLDHPNVVVVHDVGIHDRRLFVAMDFVEGQTLGQWMTETDNPRPWEDVLTVFVEAGRGLAAAHSAGLVHRDFKPDNVMLGDDGRVRVMDFGLARVATETEPDDEVVEARATTGGRASINPLTKSGMRPGTPAYMSPEQFVGQVADARSDQFSFCVALYEALYGERPFGGRWREELQDAVTRGEIREFSRGSSVPKWVRKVVFRGLEVDAQDRFESMRALLGALTDAPSARRRRWATVVGGIGLLCGSVWGVTYVTQRNTQTCAQMEEKLTGVWDDERRARVRVAVEDTGLSYAPGTWVRVEQQLDEYTSSWVKARTTACEATQRGEQSAELLDLRMACMDERLMHVRTTVDELMAADERVVEKAVSLVTNLPRLDRCSDIEALKAEIPPPEDPSVAERVSALEEQLAAARAREGAGRYEDALEGVNRIVEKALILDYEPLIARAWLLQGELQMTTGDLETAVATFERSYDLAVGQQMMEEAASSSTHLMWVLGIELARHDEARRWAIHAGALSRAARTDEARARHLQNLGVLAEKEGNYDFARSYHEQALAIKVKTYGPDHALVTGPLNGLGTVATSEGEYEMARHYHKRALTIREKTQGPEHPDVALSLANLGAVAYSEGKYELARANCERALSILEESLGPEHPRIMLSLTTLGIIAYSQGNYDFARQYLGRALAAMEKTLGPEHRDLAYPINNLGSVALLEGEYEEARQYYERALAIDEKSMGPEHVDVAYSLTNLGTVADLQGMGEKAREYHTRALSIWEATLGPDHPNVASTLNSLAGLADAEGKTDEALQHFERALAIRERKLGLDHPDVAMTINNLGVLARGQGRYKDALRHSERALSIQRRVLDPDHPLLGSTLTNIGRTLNGQRKYNDAIPYLERALAIRKSVAHDPAKLAETYIALARALWGAPDDEGRDRPRAQELAKSACNIYMEEGPRAAEELEEVEAWIAARVHAQPR